MPRLYPGDSALLVTKVPSQTPRSRMVFSCPSTKEPDRKCEGHAIKWVRQPHYAVIMNTLRRSNQTAGRSLMECGADGHGALQNCRVGGVTTPESTTAILELSGFFVAPQKAIDRTPLNKGRIVVEIDWSEVNPTPTAPAGN